MKPLFSESPWHIFPSPYMESCLPLA